MECSKLAQYISKLQKPDDNGLRRPPVASSFTQRAIIGVRLGSELVRTSSDGSNENIKLVDLDILGPSHILSPGAVVHGQTLEVLEVHEFTDAAFLSHGSNMQAGLLVQSIETVTPGEGCIPLSIKNFGVNDLRLFPGMEIGCLMFHYRMGDQRWESR